jgi:hypothetical protein
MDRRIFCEVGTEILKFHLNVLRLWRVKVLTRNGEYVYINFGVDFPQCGPTSDLVWLSRCMWTPSAPSSLWTWSFSWRKRDARSCAPLHYFGLSLRLNDWFIFRSCGFDLIGIVGGGVQLGPLDTAATNRPIVPAPGDYDNGETGRMSGRGNRSTRRKPAPVSLCPPQTPLAARTRTRTAAVGSQRLTASATARPIHLPVYTDWSFLLRWAVHVARMGRRGMHIGYWSKSQKERGY